MSINQYEKKQIDEIAAWKGEEPGVVSNAVGFLLTPVTWLVNKVIPTSAIQSVLEGANKIAELSSDEKDILRDAGVSTIEEIRGIPLDKCDELANDVHNWAIGLATAEGGITGALGVFGLVADIPLTITFALRTIHKIGLCYGYKLNDEQGKQIVLGVMAASGSNTMEEKAAALLTLHQIKVLVQKTTWRAMEKIAENQFTKEAGVLATKAVAKTLGINMTKRKTLQAIPLVGAAVGASVNGWYIKEVGWAARREFQERWLLDNDKIHISQ
jgi:uncharacterized protein (DUF697 family)